MRQYTRQKHIQAPDLKEKTCSFRDLTLFSWAGVLQVKTMGYDAAKK